MKASEDYLGLFTFCLRVTVGPPGCHTPSVRSARGLGAAGIAVAVGFYLIVVAVLAGLWRIAAEANGRPCNSSRLTRSKYLTIADSGWVSVV